MPKRKTYINPAFQLENVGFFRTAYINADGNLRSAGISYSLHDNDWSDTRRMYCFPYYTFNMMLAGSSGAYRNENGFKCQLEYGDFFLTFPDTRHLYGPGKGECWNELYVNYGGSAFDQYYQEKYFYPARPVWHLEEPQPWIERLQTMLQRKRPTTAFAVAAETSRFLCFLFEILDVALPKSTSDQGNDWFDRACLLLSADMRQVDLREIARELGMGYSSFRSHFARRSGMPPYQYREMKRMEAACIALAHNPSKLHKEIAFSLGYAREDHFTRQFKKHMGILPSEYRKKYGGNSDR